MMFRVEADLAEVQNQNTGSDWRHVFAYAENFNAADVARVVASANGENDGASWVAILALKSGKFAYLTASCDYTGWG